jgi:hypothetical protein
MCCALKKRKGFYFSKRAAVPLSAHQSKPARCKRKLAPARAAPAPDCVRPQLPRGDHPLSKPAGWRPVAPAARARLHPRPGSPSRTSPPLPPLASRYSARAPASATATMRALAGVGRSDHHSPPPEPPSSSEHRLLALAHSGNAPIRSNCSSEFWASSPENTALWTPTLRSPFSFLRVRISFALLSRSSRTISRTSPWSVLAARR